jgi:DNA invertase Pin-like site-specific DNA recombinase
MCREFADRHDWVLPEEFVYCDEALSGAGSDRPGLTALLKAASRPERPFDILLIDDTSRLSRNLADAVRMVETLRFQGLRVVSVSQGIDSQNEQSDVLMTVHGLVDSLYIKELAKKTHRGLEGRALQGLSTGGRCYGYDNIREGESVRLQINASEAAIVRKIFQMAADGGSLKTITKCLNRDHVPPPRKRTGKSDGTWCPSAIREMLRRDLYIGRVIWNRSKFVKQPGTNKRLRRERPESEWRILERPELRIISSELWDGVQRHIASMAERFNYGNHPGLMRRVDTSPNLLSGFLKCGVCSANLIIVSGRGKNGNHRYGCPQNFNRGACSNGVKERADYLQERLLSELEKTVLRPEAIEAALQEFENQLQAALAALESKIDRMRQRETEIGTDLGRLISLAAKCDHSPSLIEAINTLEQERRDITRQLLSAEPDSVAAEVGCIRQFVSGQLGTIRDSIRTSVAKAKAELHKHVSGIRMLPQAEGKKGFYVAEGNWDLLGGYGEDSGSSGIPHFRMVAGEQFGRKVLTLPFRIELSQSNEKKIA